MTTFGRIIAHDGLKLRKTPGPKGVALDLMPEGDRVIILPRPGGSPGGWWRVRWLPTNGPELEGWAWAEYVKREPDLPPPAKPPDWHKWVGIGLMLAVVLAIAFAIVGLPPPWGDWR